MPKIVLNINIEIDNYTEIVRKEEGKVSAFLTQIPGVRVFIRNKVDSVIEDTIFAEVAPNLTKELQKALETKGIVAKVEVSRGIV